MSGHTERDFETAIEAGLVSYRADTRHAKPGTYDEALALCSLRMSVGFLKRQSAGEVGGAGSPSGGEDGDNRPRRVSPRSLELKGTLHVLRHGFKCYGKTFRMAYFRPNTKHEPRGG